jgi:hypothetical protein
MGDWFRAEDLRQWLTCLIGQYFEEIFNTGRDLPIRTDLRTKTNAKHPKEYLEWALSDQHPVDEIYAALAARMLNVKISILKIETLEVVDLNHATGMTGASIVLLLNNQGVYGATRNSSF